MVKPWKVAELKVSGHYNRAMEAYTELYETIQRLQYREFFSVRGTSSYSEELEEMRSLHTESGNRGWCKEMMNDLHTSLKRLIEDFEEFK